MKNESAGHPVSLVPPDTAGPDSRPKNDNFRPLQKGRKLIVFVLGGARFAVDSLYVSEVVRDLNAAGIPGTPDWVVGIANLRSEIVTVVDLERVMGRVPSVKDQPPKHIVVRHETMDALIAFKVEKLREVVTIGSESVRSVPEAARPFVSGVFDHQGEACTVINIGKLVESLKLA